MLKQFCGWLKRFIQGIFGKKSLVKENPPNVEPRRQWTDAEYESVFLELLDGVNQGWSRGRVKGFLLGKNVDDADLLVWLRGFGERLLASDTPNTELAARMVCLGELGVGEVGEVAGEIGLRLGGRNHTETEETEEEMEEADVWFSQGNEQYFRGDFEDAVASYDQAINFKPDFHEAWFNRGVALVNLGRYEDAVASYDQAINFKPDFHEAWFNRGSALVNLGRYEDALASYDQAIKFKPDFHEAWFNRGNALDNLGRYEDAVASYDQAINFKPDFHEAWFNRGVALGNLGRYEDAVASFDQAIKFKPDKHEAWLGRGLAAGNLVSYNQPSSLLIGIVQTNPNLNKRGYEGKLISYEEGLKKCLQETHPKGWGLLNQAIGNAHYYRGRGDSRPHSYWYKAANSYNQALKTLTKNDYPEEHLDVLQDLIRVQSSLGKTDKAEELQRLGSDVLRNLLAKTKSPAKRQQLALKFASFQQLTVDLVVQSGNWCAALEIAETGKNACLSWLLDGWSDDISSPKWADIQQLLNSTTAIVYWHLSPAALHTFILTHNAPSPIVLGETKLVAETKLRSQAKRLYEFEKWVAEWNEQYYSFDQGEEKNLTPQPPSLQGKGENSKPGDRNNSKPLSSQERGLERGSNWRNNLPKLLEQLSNILDIPAIIQSIQNSIPPYPPLSRGDCKTQNLILIPHRDLHRFPLHALFLHTFTITYLPSAQIGLSVVGKAPIVPANRYHELSLLSVEHPTSKGLPNLEFAEVESETICQIFPNRDRLSSENATREAVQTALLNNHDIFHFTGHGKYEFSNPALSYLALADKDRLTIADIRIRELTSYRLVNLAACETYITSKQTITTEYVGLVSGFMGCGVAHVVSTLWTVESEASALVMMQFYHNLKDGKPEAIALAEATQWLRNVSNGELVKWYEAKIARLTINEPCLHRFLQYRLDKLRQTTQPNHQPYQHPYFWAAFTITGTF